MGAVGTGMVVTLYGLTRLVPGSETFVETKIRPFERRLIGAYVVGVGLLIAALGIVRATSPGALTRLRDAGIARILELAK